MTIGQGHQKLIPGIMPGSATPICGLFGPSPMVEIAQTLYGLLIQSPQNVFENTQSGLFQGEKN